MRTLHHQRRKLSRRRFSRRCKCLQRVLKGWKGSTPTCNCGLSRKMRSWRDSGKKLLRRRLICSWWEKAIRRWVLVYYKLDRLKTRLPRKLKSKRKWCLTQKHTSRSWALLEIYKNWINSSRKYTSISSQTLTLEAFSSSNNQMEIFSRLRSCLLELQDFLFRLKWCQWIISSSILLDFLRVVPSDW